MKHPLYEEALWAANQTRKVRGPEDSALLFVSWNALDAQLDALKLAWGHSRINHAVAIKSQPHPSILRHIARAAGCPSERIVFDSPVKRVHEIADCAQNNPGLLVNANSIQELNRLLPFAGELRIGLRINPMVETDAPSVYQVSGDESKFGEAIANRDGIIEAIVAHPIVALHVHSGSSIKDFEGAIRAIVRIYRLAIEANAALADHGIDRRITTLDLGGGLLPELLENGRAPKMDAYTARLRSELPELWTDFDLVTEFGQWTHFHSGYALSDVEYVLERGSRQVAYLHLGADFLLRDAYVRPRGIAWLPTRSGLTLPGGTVPTLRRALNCQRFKRETKCFFSEPVPTLTPYGHAIPRAPYQPCTELISSRAG